MINQRNGASFSVMKLGYVLMYVGDVSKTAEFYKRAFGVELAFLHESGDYAEMETGDTRLGFVALPLARENADFETVQRDRPAPGIEVSFITGSIDKAFAQAIQEGATEVLAPKLKPWGQWVCYVRDCNGFLIEICTSMETELA